MTLSRNWLSDFVNVDDIRLFYENDARFIEQF